MYMKHAAHLLLVFTTLTRIVSQLLLIFTLFNKGDAVLYCLAPMSNECLNEGGIMKR